MLFIGNSHTYQYEMPFLFEALCEADGTGRQVYVEIIAVANAFLEAHAAEPGTLATISDREWDVVVLQGQKYSTSGRYEYPTDAARELIGRARDNDSRAILFPEWRRQGHPDEGRRVHALHQSIAVDTGAEVAPVGLAWDRVLDEGTDIVLHAPDGNHCSLAGAYLTACVLYCQVIDRPISDEDGGMVPELTGAQRRSLEEAAWRAVEAERS